uniref:Protein YNG1 n=1 Tax=Magallana gigas TaxID=29159 RepID=K1R5V6_MAGGI
MEGKRLLTPLKTPRKIKIYRPSGTTPKKIVVDLKQKAKKNIGYAVRCIENHEYRKGFSYLYQNFAGARRALHVLVKKEVRRGIRMLLRDKENKVHQKCTYENMKDFKWPDITQAVDQFVPLLSTAIIAAVTTTKNERSLRGPKDLSLIPALGLVSAVLLHMRSPRINLVQGLHGVELWRCGAQRKKHMGLGFDEPTDADMDSTNSDADETIDTDEDDNSSVESGMSSDSNSLLPMLELESVASDTSIDIGVCQENPSTTEGTIRILERLHEYVPRQENLLFPLICYGDGLSCERHNDAHMARANAGTPLEGLQGLQPVAQEFHKRMLLMQDTMDIFFSGKSAQDKGTLFHLKNLFGHRGVKKQIGDSFNHASTFLKFVTYGYTLLAAMEVLHMESITDEPTDIDTVRNKTEYVMNTARQIVDLIWFEIDVNRIVNAREDGSVYEFCYCKEELGDDVPMVECTGANCPGNNWFHIDCVTGGDGDFEQSEDFACSEECRGSYKYCCGVDLGKHEPMIGCDNTACPLEWFHMKCVGLKTAPRGKWYCNQCKSGTDQPESVVKPDLKNLYVRALTYHGLMDLVRHDAVRENDGDAMMGHWRYDVVQFHNRHHPKYVVLAHRLLAECGIHMPAAKIHGNWSRNMDRSENRLRFRHLHVFQNQNMRACEEKWM